MALLYRAVPYILNSNTTSLVLYRDIITSKYTYIFLYLETIVIVYFYKIVKTKRLLRIIRVIAINKVYYAYITN